MGRKILTRSTANTIEITCYRFYDIAHGYVVCVAGDSGIIDGRILSALNERVNMGTCPVNRNVPSLRAHFILRMHDADDTRGLSVWCCYGRPHSDIDIDPIPPTEAACHPSLGK